MAGNLVNCHVKEDAVTSGLEVVDTNLPNQILYIVPDEPVNAWDPVYTVKAEAFKDNTKTTYPNGDNWDGIIAQLDANNLDITFTNTIGPNVVGNMVKVTINLEDSFFLQADQIVTVDLLGVADQGYEKEAVIALQTDFAKQIRGGSWSVFDTTTGPGSVNYSGRVGVGKVTFTPAVNMTDVSGGQDFTPVTSPTISSTAIDYHNDFKTQNEVIYVKGTFTLDRSGQDEGWIKVGTITVELDNTELGNGISANEIPSSAVSEGEYGFVFREANKNGNSFNGTSAISKEVWEIQNHGMEQLAVVSHQLRDSNGNDNNAFDPETDTHTGADSIDEFLYGTWSNAMGPWEENPSQTFEPSQPNTSSLCTKWQRDWYFRYPNAEELDELGLLGVSVASEFTHSESDMTNAVVNNFNDLSLSGFLTAAPPLLNQNTKYINNITITPSLGDLELSEINGWVGPPGETEGPNNKAWLIPASGNDSTDVGNRIALEISGYSGAEFKVEIIEVEVITRATGRSSGDGVVGSFRNAVQWGDVVDNNVIPTDPLQAGITTVITLPNPSEQPYELVLPDIPAHTDVSEYKNYYLRVIAQGDTQIRTTAHNSAYGSDVVSGDWQDTYINGINYNAPGNTIQIRLRQQNTDVIKLVPNISGFPSEANISFDAVSTPSAGALAYYNQWVEGYYLDNNGPNFYPLEVEFRWVLHSSETGKFKFNPEFFRKLNAGGTGITDQAHSDDDHELHWPATSCTVTYNESTNPEGDVCSLSNINRTSQASQLYPFQETLEDGSDRFLITHNFPSPGVDTTPASIIIDTQLGQGGSNAAASYYGAWPNNWNTGGASALQKYRPGPSSVQFSSDYKMYGNQMISQYYNDKSRAYIKRNVTLTEGQTYQITSNIHSCGGTGTPMRGRFIIVRPSQDFGGTQTGYAQISQWFDARNAEEWNNWDVINDTGVDAYVFNQDVNITYVAPTAGQYKIIAYIESPNTTDDHTQLFCQFSHISITELNEFTNYQDHSSTFNNGGEAASVNSFQAVLGKVTAWDYETDSGTIDSGGDYDNYLTVLGKFEVQMFGTSNNVYEVDLSKIATWES